MLKILASLIIRCELFDMSRLLDKFLKKKPSFHFIHIPKNGGMALRQAFSEDRSVSMSDPYHYRYKDIETRLPVNIRSFSVVRNPWSRTASRYFYAKQNAKAWLDNDPRKQYIEKASFTDFIQERKIFDIPDHLGKPWMGPMNSWFNQLEWLTDHQGQIACECLRLEHLNDDMSRLFERSITIPKANQTEYKYDYRALYNDKSIKLIADVFSEDIEHFGFTFEGGAKKNIVGL